MSSHCRLFPLTQRAGPGVAPRYLFVIENGTRQSRPRRFRGEMGNSLKGEHSPLQLRDCKIVSSAHITPRDLGCLARAGPPKIEQVSGRVVQIRSTLNYTLRCRRTTVFFTPYEE